MNKITFIFLILITSGCVSLEQSPSEKYLGQEIQNKSDAKKYYGTSITQLESNIYEVYVVVPLRSGWESRILDIFMEVIKSKCSEAFRFEAFDEELHGPIGADLSPSWNAISKKGILECKIELTSQSDE